MDKDKYYEFKNDNKYSGYNISYELNELCINLIKN